jgi:hypothetical protein
MLLLDFRLLARLDEDRARLSQGHGGGQERKQRWAHIEL